MKLNEHLKELRAKSSETQKQVASAVGTHERNVRRLESGTALPSVETLVHIAKHFNVSTDYLLDVQPTVKTLAHAYTQLTPNQQKELLSMIRSNDR